MRWGYAWIPVVAPLIGGVIGAGLFILIGILTDSSAFVTLQFCRGGTPGPPHYRATVLLKLDTTRAGAATE
jgi:hypothetical protein